MLDSLVGSVDIYDKIILKSRKDGLSSITMHGMHSESIPPEDNNALKAAEAFSKTFSTTGADIVIYKNIPMGAGLGGSSADVSGVLNGMAKLYNVTDVDKLGEIADSLGSDTRYMLTGGFARMQGRGEQVAFLGIDKTLHMLLLCPDSAVSTVGCYREYDQDPPKKTESSITEKCIEALGQNNLEEIGRYLTNDLCLPATRLNKAVLQAYEEASSFSPIATFMTGSGSCVCALFETRELCEWAKSRYRGKSKAYVVKTVCPKTQKKKMYNPFYLTEAEQNNNE